MKIRVWYVVALWDYDYELNKIHDYNDFYEYVKGPVSFNEGFTWMNDNQIYDDTHGRKYDMIYDYIEIV